MGQLKQITAVNSSNELMATAVCLMRSNTQNDSRNKRLGHSSKAVHRAYAKNAEVTIPSLDD